MMNLRNAILLSFREIACDAPVADGGTCLSAEERKAKYAMAIA